MHFLVDTNIWSETLRKSPEPRVVAWLESQERELFMSAVTVGELKSGIDLLPRGKRRSNYQSWLNALVDRMEGRILSFNTSVALVWGQLLAKCRSEGRIPPAIDSQIAATAKRHALTLATRNENDFRYAGVKVLNPFRV